MYWISFKRVSSGHKKKVDHVVPRYQEKNVLCIIYYFNDLLWYYFLTIYFIYLFRSTRYIDAIVLLSLGFGLHKSQY